MAAVVTTELVHCLVKTDTGMHDVKVYYNIYQYVVVREQYNTNVIGWLDKGTIR